MTYDEVHMAELIRANSPMSRAAVNLTGCISLLKLSVAACMLLLWLNDSMCLISSLLYDQSVPNYLEIDGKGMTYIMFA